MKQTRWKITNDTVKPPQIDPQTKRDMRRATDKVGHAVRLTDPSGRRHTLYQKKFVFVEEINEGILNLERGGFVKVEKVDDITTALRQHTIRPSAAKTVAGSVQPDSSPENPNTFGVSETAEDAVPSSNHGSNIRAARQADAERKASAVEMGHSSNQQAAEDATVGDSTIAGAINPDGQPNFAVTAKHDGESRRGRSRLG